MPRENKKRGRRMQGNKRTYDEAIEDEVAQGQQNGESSNKRRRSIDVTATNVEQDFIPLDESAEQEQSEEGRPFYGLLDDDEQEFFRHAGETLDANDFSEPSDKEAFLTNVFREAEGKELKLANSQSCSRLLEKLIKNASSAQIRNLLEKFAGDFNHLMTHRFASHTCEALLARAAALIAEEVKARARDDVLQNAFLAIPAMVQRNIGYLITDQYASHVLRVLLLTLAGESLSSESSKSLLRSKRKENKLHDEKVSEAKSHPVPASFSRALQELIAESMAGLSTDQVRALATHPNANPTLQLLLRLELSHLGKQRGKDEGSVIRTLLPDEPITSNCDSTSFINGMVYDAVGSHMIETIVQSAPAKLFKNLYKVIFKERLVSYARNEIASHIACRVLERLGADDLLEVHELLIPHVSDLLRKNRTNVVRTLIERCAVRDIDTKVIALQVNNTWSTEDGFEIQKLLKTVKPPIKTNGESLNDKKETQEMTEIYVTEAIKTHFNILAQAMLLVPGALSALVLDSLVALEAKELLSMSYDPIVSRTLQTALTTKVSSIITTRKLVQHFYGQIGAMALDKAASHVVDCIWEGTHGLAFIRERIAEELAENEPAMRESPFGRAVWKNWKMDIYKRKRGEWIRQSKIKASNDGFQSFSELDETKKTNGDQKTPLELARERHARSRKAKEDKMNDNPGRSTRPNNGGDGGSAPTAAAAG